MLFKGSTIRTKVNSNLCIDGHRTVILVKTWLLLIVISVIQMFVQLKKISINLEKNIGGGKK